MLAGDAARRGRRVRSARGAQRPDALASEDSIRQHALGVFAGIATLLSVLALLARFDLPDGYPSVVAVVVSGLVAIVLAMRWPERAWRWGLWISITFWLFFGLVVIALREIGRPALRPVEDAVAVTLSACAAAWLGNRIATGARRRSVGS